MKKVATRYIQVLFVSLMAIATIGCNGSPEVKKKEEVIPARGKWASLVLNSSPKSRIVFLKDQFQSEGWKFGPNFRVERAYSGGLSFDPYMNVLKIPGQAKGSVARVYGLKKGILAEALPQLTEEQRREVEILAQNIRMVDTLARVLWKRYKLGKAQFPWDRYESSLRMGLAFLWKIESDPYIKWLIIRLHRLYRHLDGKLGKLDLAEKKEERRDWLHLNFPRILSQTPQKGAHILLHQRLALFNAGEISWAKELKRLEELRQQAQQGILFPNRDLSVRTLYTGDKPLTFDTNIGKRFRGIAWIATDGKEALYFSDFNKIYRLERGGKKKVILEGDDNFFHPTTFYLESSQYLYLVDPPYFRKIHLKKKKVTNYSFEGIIPDLSEHSFAGIYPFTVDDKGNIYIVDDNSKTIFKLRPNNYTKKFEILARYKFKGHISALFAKDNYLYASHYSGHVIKRINLALGEWENYVGREAVSGHQDGNFSRTLFYRPFGLVYSKAAGAFYVGDEANHALRKVKGNQVFTVVGMRRGNQDGSMKKAALSLPSALAVDGQGAVFFVEQGTGAIRVVAPVKWSYQGSSPLEYRDIASELDKARSYYKNKKYQKAANILTEAIKVAPIGLSLYRALRLRGRIFSKVGFHQQAAKNFTRCLSLNPRLTEPYLLRGQSHLAAKEYDKAREDFSHVIEKKKNLHLRKKCQDEVYIQARMGRFESYGAEGETKKAITLASDLLRFLSSARTGLNIKTLTWEIQILEKRARLYEKAGEAQNALEDYRQLLKYQPKNQVYMWKISQLLFQLGRYYKSRDMAKKILDLKSNFAPAHELLGRMYYRHISDDKKALVHYQYYLELDGDKKALVKSRIREIIAQRKQPGDTHTDIIVEKNGRKIKVRYHSNGKVERIPIFD